jgi:hypothetical protein
VRILSIEEAHEELLAKADGPVKQKFVIHDVHAHIENPAGSNRHWHDPKTGHRGKQTMKHPYGFLPGTKGADGDSVDVFVGPHLDSDKVFVINQRQRKDGRRFDEHKVILGALTEAEAREVYLQNYDEHGPKLLGSIVEWSVARFKRWLESKGKKDRPVRKALP